MTDLINQMLGGLTTEYIEHDEEEPVEGSGGVTPMGMAKLSIVNGVVQVNKQDLETSINSATNMSVEETLKVGQNCGAATVAAQRVNTGDISAVGPGSTVRIALDQNISVNLSCIQATDLQSKFSGEMMNQMMSDILSNTSQDVVAKIGENIQNEPLEGNTVVPLDQSIVNNFSSTNETHKKIQMVVSREIKKKFTASSMQDVLNSVILSQQITTGNITAAAGGTVTIGASQAVTSMTDAISNTRIVTETAFNIMDSLGIKVVENTKQEATSDIKPLAPVVVVRQPPPPPPQPQVQPQIQPQVQPQPQPRPQPQPQSSSPMPTSETTSEEEGFFSSTGGKILLLLCCLLVIGGIGFAVYWFVIRKPEEIKEISEEVVQTGGMLFKLFESIIKK
jgi:hypothetical protein